MGYLFTTIARIWETFLQAIGGHLVVGLGGILFLGFPAAFWCGAYGYAVAAKFGLGVGLSIGVGILLSALSGAIFGFFYARMSNDSFAVITLASVLATEALIQSWDSVTGGVLGIAGVPRMTPNQSLENLILVELVVAGCAFFFEWLLLHSSFGRSLRALREDKNSLIALGSSASLIGQLSILFATLSIGVAGIFGAMRIQFLDPSMGGLILLAQILTISIIAHAPKTLRLLVITTIVVLLPEVLRFVDLPVSTLGYLRNILYSLMLIVLIYYVIGESSNKRHV